MFGPFAGLRILKCPPVGTWFTENEQLVPDQLRSAVLVSCCTYTYCPEESWVMLWISGRTQSGHQIFHQIPKLGGGTKRFRQKTKRRVDLLVLWFELRFMMVLLIRFSFPESESCCIRLSGSQLHHTHAIIDLILILAMFAAWSPLIPFNSWILKSPVVQEVQAKKKNIMRNTTRNG